MQPQPGQEFALIVADYIKWAIGHLSIAQEEKIAALTPHLQKTFNCSGSWQRCVESGLGINDQTPLALREMWKENLRISEQQNMPITPDAFAAMVLRDNFGINTAVG